VATYAGSVSLSAEGTYWYEVQPTAAIANHYYCSTASTSQTGSASRWLQMQTLFAGGSDSSSWTTFSGGIGYPLFSLFGTRAAPTTPTVAPTTPAAIPETCATAGTCKVGDTGPGGGIVFYVASSNFTSTGSDCGAACKYLEAAPSDHSSKVAWCSDTTTALGVTAQGIGSGMSNTTTADTTCTSGAIQVAADYTNNSKTDWYLPSRAELNELCKYAQTQTTGTTSEICNTTGNIRGGFAADRYWSSSEGAANFAWYQYFHLGLQFNNFKANSSYVRPVRAF